MNILDVLNSPWAILPDKLAQIRDIYFDARRRHAEGEPFDVQKFEAQFGKPNGDEPKAYEVVDGVAVIPVEGVIARKMNLFSRISGGTSSQMLGGDFAAALDDPKVHSLLLLIDSPGGEVSGTQELANQIFAARGQKPVVALCEGMMASAAYWIGSAADELYISCDTTQVGSIGVIASHTDASRAEQMRGVKVTEITAGKYKAVGSPHAPLSAEDREVIQGDVDYIYSVFVNDVARNRSVDVQKVLAEMADGKIFLGRQALEAGLVDGMATAGELIRTLVARKPSKPLITNRSAVAAPKGLTAMETPNGTTQPAAGAVTVTAADVEAAKRLGFDEGFKAGTTHECERIQAVEKAALPGHEALVAEMKFDGKTSGAEAAQRVVLAERTKLGQIAANLRTDAPPPAPHVSTDRETAVERNARGGQGGQDETPEEVEAAAKNEWATNAKLHREFRSEASYIAFKKAEARGTVRILRSPRAS